MPGLHLRRPPFDSLGVAAYPAGVTEAVRERVVRRVDGPEKVTGAALYAGDVPLPGLLVGIALRSPIPHARITALDVSAARRLPGVRAVLTGADLPVPLIGRGLRDMPPLAWQRVRFVGEKIAVVAAETRDAAEEALNAIRLEYEDLPGVFDIETALLPDAPALHPDRETYASGYERGPLPPEPNANSTVVVAKGEVEAGFERSARVFEDVFRLPMQHVGFIEPHSCTVAIEPSGKVRVWSCVKQLFGVREYLAQATGLAAEQFIVMPNRIGGDFGGKGYIVDEALAYFLAKASGRPVQMVMSQNEEFQAGIPRHAAVIRIKSGVDQGGRLVARDVRVLYNSGAYAGFRGGITLAGSRRAAGPYRIPNVRIVTSCVYTNQLPCGSMRAPGQPQVTFACESHTDMVARRLGIDPVEFRHRNLLRDGDEDLDGKPWCGSAGEVLDQAARAIGWGQATQANQGRGLAISERGTGAGRAEVAVEVDAQGRVLVRTGVPEVGTGAHTVLQEVVARVLTVEPSAVRVEQGDSDNAPFDSGSGGSKVTNSTGGAAFAAVQQLRRRLCSLAAEVEGWREDGVELEDGHFVSRDDLARIRFAELAGRLAKLEGGLIGEQVDLQAERGPSTGYGCQAFEVSVDRETGQVRVDRIVAVHDVGYTINPRGLTGQVEGGLMQGLGQGLMEELRVEQGRVQAINFGDYKVPGLADIPPLEIELIEHGDGPAPFGGKGVGEMPAIPTAAALANAVEDAVGVRITDLPISAEKVFNALRGR
ncbi:MAG TPA: xanthine dehydrogenase family protein molybdopterin-binding subunit [Chloroflexota bacterium]|nr:xanthine dehydrogenase family protein molybdopterin-binding subunit [Chloroflexota bacterium]